MIEENKSLTLLVKKKAWTQQEDDKLVELVTKFGPEKWTKLADYFEHRTGKQCRQRWHNHLNPHIKKQDWTDQQQWLLFLSHKVYGNKWAQITKHLNGRTDNTIKNRWNSTMQKKIPQLKIRLANLYLQSKINPLVTTAMPQNQKFLFKIIQQNYENDILQNLIEPKQQFLNQDICFNTLKKGQIQEEKIILEQTVRRQIKEEEQNLQHINQSTRKKKIQKTNKKKNNRDYDILSRSPPKQNIFIGYLDFCKIAQPSKQKLDFGDENNDPNQSYSQKHLTPVRAIKSSYTNFRNQFSPTIILTWQNQEKDEKKQIYQKDQIKQKQQQEDQ